MKSKDQDSSLWLSIGYITSYIITIGDEGGASGCFKNYPSPSIYFVVNKYLLVVGELP